MANDCASWDERRTRLDDNRAFNAMRDTPYYREAEYEQFSGAEYARRYAALREIMRREGLDAAIVPGGPSHWSFGGGMLWLTGHWEWHALAAYVVVPLDGDPTLVYAMGGTHVEAVRRAVAIDDVRPSRGGRYAHVIAERLTELGLTRGRIGLLEIDPRHGDHLPANQLADLRERLPQAELVFTTGIMHELLSVKSEEELACVRRAGELCQRAMEALVERAQPGVHEFQLKAAAAHAILDGGGDIDFLIIGATPGTDPAQVFGNPRPSRRQLEPGDLINMELAAGYRGYTAQIGSPLVVGHAEDALQRFWDEIARPGYERMAAAVRPHAPVTDLLEAGRFFREQGVQSRPIHAHGIGLVTDGPHVYADAVHAEPFERTLRPNTVLMPEPNPISADGMLGMFVGHTFVIGADGATCVDDFPLELVVT